MAALGRKLVLGLVLLWIGAAFFAVSAPVGMLALVVVFLRILFFHQAKRFNTALFASACHAQARRFDEAERAIEPMLRHPLAYFRRSALLQHAEIAACRPDLGEAVARSTLVIETPIAGMGRGTQRRCVLLARGLRALVRAPSGDEVEVRADIDAVLGQAVDASPRVRAVLAEALLFERKGERGKLREHLDRTRKLWTRLVSRERWLARALDAMLFEDPGSAYRANAERSDAGLDPENHEARWVAAFAPSAARFVRNRALVERSAAPAQETTPAQASEDARRLVLAARPRITQKKSGAFALAWILGVLAACALWVFPDKAATWPHVIAGALVAAVSGLGLWRAVFVYRRGVADRRRVAEGLRALQAGEAEEAAARLAFRPESPATRADACRHRAEIELGRGNMERALKECDAALEALAEMANGQPVQPRPPAKDGTVAWDFPRVVAAERAYALAALGRTDEALAEVEWAKGLPDGTTLLRIRLLARLRAGDLEGAQRVAETRDPDTVLGSHEETMLELLRFICRPATRNRTDVLLFRAELARSDSAAWLRSVAPSLLEAFQRIEAVTS